MEGKEVERGESILQLAVKGNDIVGFSQRIQALGLVAKDFRPAFSSVPSGENNEFWVTFRFADKGALMRSYVSLIYNGFVRRISYSYSK